MLRQVIDPAFNSNIMELQYDTLKLKPRSGTTVNDGIPLLRTPKIVPENIDGFPLLTIYL
jgi:hypothetical protein